MNESSIANVTVMPNLILSSNYTSYISLTERIANVLALMPLLILGTIGNITVLLVIITGRNKAQRSKSNAFVFFLAVSDLVFLLTAALPNVTRYAAGTKKWLLPDIFCQICVFFSYASANSGAMIIACFSLARLLAVCYPEGRASRLNFRQQVAALALVLIFATSYSSIWLFNVGISKKGYNVQECHFLHSRNSYLLIFGVDFGAFFIMPVLVMVIANGFLVHQIISLRLMKSDEQKAQDRLSSSTRFSNGSANNGSLGSRSTTLSSTTRYLPRKSIADGQIATKILIVVAIVFIATCLPYRLLVLYNSLGLPTSPKGLHAKHWISHVCRWLWYANSAINPVLYSLISKKFRNEVRKMLTFKKTQRLKNQSLILIEQRKQRLTTIVANNANSRIATKEPAQFVLKSAVFLSDANEYDEIDEEDDKGMLRNKLSISSDSYSSFESADDNPRMAITEIYNRDERDETSFEDSQHRVTV